MRDPDLAQAPVGVKPRESVPQRVALSGWRYERFQEDVAPCRRQRMNRVTNLVILDCFQGFTHLDLGHGAERRTDVAVVLLHFPFEFPLDVVCGPDP